MQLSKTSKSILLVDSNSHSKKIMENAIRQTRHTCLACVHTIDDLEKCIATNEPDLIVINISTKGEYDGYQLAKMVKIDYEIPFYILFSEFNFKEQKWAKELNPDGYICSSDNEAYLKSQLESLIELDYPI